MYNLFRDQTVSLDKHQQSVKVINKHLNWVYTNWIINETTQPMQRTIAF